MELSENEIKITQLAFDEFLKQKIKVNLNMMFEMESISPYCTHLKQQRQQLKVNTAKKYGTLYLFLTVSPDEKKTNFEKFRDKVSSVANRSMIHSSHYCFEQRGQTVEDCGKGFHLHMLIRRNIDYNQKKIIENLKNSFKKFTNVNDFNVFNYHWTKQEYVQDKIDYMTKPKQGIDSEEKQKKQVIDKLFRQKKNLKEYYKTCPENPEIKKEKESLLDIEKDSENKETPTTCITPEFQELFNSAQ